MVHCSSNKKNVYVFTYTWFPIEPIDNPFQFHDTLQGVPVKFMLEKGLRICIL